MVSDPFGWIGPNNPNGKTYGEGEISDMYIDVENTITTATASYRDGKYFPADPYPWMASMSPPTGALIAVQKVDVVAHSYGGLLTRWYIEQSGDFASRRDVRKLIELGTPNLGSPLANMVDEAYRNPLVGGSFTNLLPLTLTRLLNIMDQRGKSGGIGGLASSVAGSPAPFFEDASVGSDRLNALNADPFSDDVSYAAVVGDQSIMLGWVGKLINMNPYSVFQPMLGGASYFPWLDQFDLAGTTDAIVPTWSASLGVPSYNFVVGADHVDLVQNAAVQGRVIQWLSDPGVPLGSAQRAAWMNQPPVSEQNAYQGAHVDPATGQLVGGGVWPNAIVGVSLPDTGFGTASFGTDPSHVGAYVPTLTGMIQAGDVNVHVSVEISAYGANRVSTLDTLDVVPSVAFNIDPAELAGAHAGDWVKFSAPIGAFGRRQLDELTGPSGSADWIAPTEGVTYSLEDVEISPPTFVSLPDFALPTPQVSNGALVTVSGAVEYGGPGTTANVTLYAKQPFYQWDTNLGQFSPVSISLPTNPPGASGVSFWKGVLIPYSASMYLWRDSSGDVYSSVNNNNTGEQHPQIYQYLLEPTGAAEAESDTVTL